MLPMLIRQGLRLAKRRLSLWSQTNNFNFCANKQGSVHVHVHNFRVQSVKACQQKYIQYILTTQFPWHFFRIDEPDVFFYPWAKLCKNRDIRIVKLEWMTLWSATVSKICSTLIVLTSGKEGLLWRLKSVTHCIHIEVMHCTSLYIYHHIPGLHILINVISNSLKGGICRCASVGSLTTTLRWRCSEGGVTRCDHAIRMTYCLCVSRRAS